MNRQEECLLSEQQKNDKNFLSIVGLWRSDQIELNNNNIRKCFPQPLKHIENKCYKVPKSLG